MYLSTFLCPECGQQTMWHAAGDKRYHCQSCKRLWTISFRGHIGEPPPLNSPLYGESDTLENFDLKSGNPSAKGVTL